MFEIILTLALWAVILLSIELLWHLKVIRGEYSRKAVHILISISIATTPYYLSWKEIQILGAVGLLATIAMRFSRMIKSTYDIQRKSFGEIIGPASIVAVTFIEPPAIVFVAIMMNAGVADGIAAIVGTQYGKGNRYKVFGYTKSLAGTAAFFVTSLIATLGVVLVGDIGTFAELLPLILILPAAATLIENIGVYGIDNALITATTIGVFYAFV